jgi:uncharacterized protein (DUF4415 family)
MVRKPNPALIDDDAPELTDEELASLRPAKDVLAPDLYAALTKRRPGQRGPGKRPAKIQTSIRLDPVVIQTFKASGPDWQKDVNAVLLKEVQRRARQKPDVKKRSA